MCAWQRNVAASWRRHLGVWPVGLASIVMALNKLAAGAAVAAFLPAAAWHHGGIALMAAA